MRGDRVQQLKRLGLIALLVFTLGQVALLVHNVSDEHAAEDACEICAGFDRLTPGPDAPAAPSFSLAVVIILAGITGSVALVRRVRIHRLRGPPNL